MRVNFILAGLAALVAAGCEPPPGEIIACLQTWTCDDGTIIASNGENFCTDPQDQERADDIAKYQSDFATECTQSPITCRIGGVDQPSTCAATCAQNGACDITKAVKVRL